jgi:hypothetical protein
VDIISKRSGPREEDKHAKDHLRRNWGTIEKLADQISGGSYSANKARTASIGKAAEPSRSGRIFVDQSPRRSTDTPVPYLKISQNGRVVLADRNSGRQLHFLGELKRHNGEISFVIATAANGYITPLDPDLCARIGDLADKVVGRDYTEDDLSGDLTSRLNLA